MASDFAHLFCEHFLLHPATYRHAALKRALYPRAQLFRSILRIRKPDSFAADLDFIERVRRITKRRDFSVEADEFTHHPQNRGFARRVLRLRVSMGRTQELVGIVFGGTTRHPFSSPNSSAPQSR